MPYLMLEKQKTLSVIRASPASPDPLIIQRAVKPLLRKEPQDVLTLTPTVISEAPPTPLLCVVL